MSQNSAENPYGQQPPQFNQPAPPYGQQSGQLQQPYVQQPLQSPSYGQPAYSNPYYAPYPGKTLGVVGLALCLIVPLLGLILSIVAKKRSDAAGFVKNTPAKVGIILGWIFTVLSILAFVLFAVWLGSTLETINTYSG
ncbi:DUF4190 domain-containing protein [Arthrobacter sp. HY1533]|uniref:DUF4190 domain-containing protein n=1 Tax=Arthrobacter sp. HY1533 TaxID=2970919 RepID=UPI0022B9FBA4|nr:hypothetical protein [Arthrobacter sp. HY1533]